MHVLPALTLLLTYLVLPASTATADESCMSPYMAKIVGQEDFVYVWTLGAPGIGDEQDKLVTISVNPAAPTYGEVVSSVSVGSRNEAHHSGLTDDRRYLWASGLDSSRIFNFDVASDPANPRLHRTIDDFVARSGGVVGPHTNYALPGRMLITGWNNYMRNLGELLADGEAMKNFGNTVVAGDLHTRRPKQILDVPGAPLEIRCAWGERVYFTSSLIANWDKTPTAGIDDDVQYFKLFAWDGKTLSPRLSIDFFAAGLGAPHQMRFGAYALYGLHAPRVLADVADAASASPR